jgi:hypothetical protein
MSNIFEHIWHGLEVGAVDVFKGVEWVVLAPIKAGENLPKVIKVIDDLKQDGSDLIPQAATMAGDVENLAVTSAKDAAAFFLASKALWPAILAAAAEGGRNVVLDTAVLSAIAPFVQNAKNFSNLIALFEKLFADYGAFRGSLAADLKQLEADITA